MEPRRTLGKYKLQTDQSQDPYSHLETNYISEETDDVSFITACFLHLVDLNNATYVWFFSPVYTLLTAYSPPNLPLWLHTSSCPFWVIWSKCRVCYGLGLSGWLLFFTIFDLIFLAQHKFWRGVQLDLTLWNSEMTDSTLECSPGTGPLLCWGRDRSVRNYFMHDLTFPSLCLLLRRKQSFLSDQRGERCSIPTSSAKQTHRIGSLLYNPNHLEGEEELGRLSSPFNSFCVPVSSPSAGRDPPSGTISHICAPSPCPLIFLAPPYSTQFLFWDGSGRKL